MDNYIKNPKYKSILAFFCAFGWSLAYPLIKIGYEQFAIRSILMMTVFMKKPGKPWKK